MFSCYKRNNTTSTNKSTNETDLLRVVSDIILIINNNIFILFKFYRKERNLPF